MTPAAGAQRHYKRGRHGAVRAAILVVCMGHAQSALAQRLGQGIDDGISVWRTVGALLICVAVVVAAALFLKHRMAKGAALFRVRRNNARLEMIEMLRIRPQVDLCLVACDGEELLMVSSPQGASLLRHLPSGARQDYPAADRS
jgi:hypothetical protein